MIYDEATSSLDTHTEKEIMLSINEAAKGRTNLVIAHRLSTIMDADCVIVLKDGLVAERGDHPTLYAKEGGSTARCGTSSCAQPWRGRPAARASCPPRRPTRAAARDTRVEWTTYGPRNVVYSL